MDKKKILVTDRLSPEALLMLQGQDFVQVEKTKSHEIAADEIADAHALLIRSRTKVDERLLSQAKNLQVIVTATTGFDHIDFDACEKWGVTAMNCPWANVPTTAQLTWALVLACVHKVNAGHAMIKGGLWDRHLLQSMELSGKTYGIIGLGRIGSKVAQLAEAFGMHVVAYDPYCEDKNFTDVDAERVSFEECLKRADVLSFHVPLTKSTLHMLNRSHLEYIHRGAIVVNTSRGSVINEPDLVEAIEKGWVSAAGLDVFEKEPLPRTSLLLKMPQIVMTPHVGANSREAFEKASEQAALKILAFFRNGSTSDVLPPKRYPENPWT